MLTHTHIPGFQTDNARKKKPFKWCVLGCFRDHILGLVFQSMQLEAPHIDASVLPNLGDQTQRPKAASLGWTCCYPGITCCSWRGRNLSKQPASVLFQRSEKSRTILMSHRPRNQKNSVCSTQAAFLPRCRKIASHARVVHGDTVRHIKVMPHGYLSLLTSTKFTRRYPWFLRLGIVYPVTPLGMINCLRSVVLILI